MGTHAFRALLFLNLLLSTSYSITPTHYDEETTETINGKSVKISWIRIFSCTEGQRDQTFTRDEARTDDEIYALAATAKSIRISPPRMLGDQANPDYDRFAVFSIPDEYPSQALNKGLGVGCSLNSNTGEYSGPAILDKWIGTDEAKARLATSACNYGNEALPFLDNVYWANGNAGGIALGYNNPQYTNTCNWDWADLTGQDIEVWFGYYTMDCTVLDIDGFLTQCSDEYDGQIGLLNGLRTDVDANTGVIAGILSDIDGRINAALSEANTGITNNANEISRVESQGIAARGALNDALRGEISRVESEALAARGALNDALRGEISGVESASATARGELDAALRDEIDRVEAAGTVARGALGAELRVEINGVASASEEARGQLDTALRAEITRVESENNAKIAELISTIEDIQRTLTALKGNAAATAQSRFAPNYNYYNSSLLNKDYIIAFLVILNAMIVCIGCCIYSKKQSGSYRKVAFSTDDETDRQQLNI